jgi:hypothetical protein
VRAEVGVWQLVRKRWSWAGGDASVCCFADRMEMGRQLPMWGEGEVAAHTIVREGAIPEHFEPGPTRPAGPAWARPAPGPATNLTGRPWAEVLKPAKNFFGPSLARNAVFSCFTL